MPLPQPLQDLAGRCKVSISITPSYHKKGPVHVVLAHDSIPMDILHIDRPSLIPLTSMIEQRNPQVAISGAFCRNIASILAPQIMGEIVRNWNYVEVGDPGEKYAYMVYKGSHGYDFGQGKTPTVKGSVVIAGIGGLIAIRLKGIKIASSWYDDGNKATGRCIVGHNSDKHLLVIIAQEDNNPEFNLDHFHDFSVDLGCTDVVGLDGSTSAMLWYYRERWIFKPNFYKDHWNGSAVVFGAAPPPDRMGGHRGHGNS